MKDLVLSVENHADRVNALDQAHRSGTLAAPLDDERVKDEAARTKQAVHRVPSLRQLLVDIGQLDAEMQARSQRTRALHDKALLLFMELDSKVGPTLRTKMLQIEQTQSHFSEITDALRATRLEVDELAAIYQVSDRG